MSVISAGTTTTTAFKVTGDTTGTLQLKTGAVPTTAIDISATQVVTFPATTTLDFTGTLLLGDGSAAAPTLAHSGDTNTGMFFPAADTIAFSEGGVEAMRLDSAGNVGIGTTSPSRKLTINENSGDAISVRSADTNFSSIGIGVSTGSAITYIQSTNSGSGTIQPLTFWTGASERARITSAGNVGIGTTSPGNFSGVSFGDSILDVNGAIQVRGDATNGVAIFQLGGDTFRKAIIYSSVGTDTPYLAFGVATSGSSSFVSEYARITAAGDMGVGTTSPASRLDVTGAFGTSTTAFTIYNNSGASASNIARIDFRVNNTFGGNERVAAIWGLNPNAGANNGGALVFATSANGTATTPTEKARFDQAGNFGINITNPSTFGKLAIQVDGTTTPTNLGNVGPSSINLYAAGNGGLTNSTTGIFGWNATTGIGSGIGFVRENGADWGTQIRFYTHPTSTTNIGDITERARITSDGCLAVGTTSGAGTSRLRAVNGNNTNGDFNIVGQLGPNAINTSSYQFIGGNYAGADNVYIYGNGNIVNTNNSYGTLSDVKLKQDIIDAASQWDDVKAFKFRKFRFKEEVSRNPNAPHQLGLIAQELEQTSPGLVDTTPDRQKEGETMKTIKTSVLLMKATKALQEAMLRIENLEAEVNALKAN